MEQEANLIRRDRRFVCGGGREGDCSEGEGKGGHAGPLLGLLSEGPVSPRTEPPALPQTLTAGEALPSLGQGEAALPERFHPPPRLKRQLHHRPML